MGSVSLSDHLQHELLLVKPALTSGLGSPLAKDILTALPWRQFKAVPEVRRHSCYFRHQLALLRVGVRTPTVKKLDVLQRIEGLRATNLASLLGIPTAATASRSRVV